MLLEQGESHICEHHQEPNCDCLRYSEESNTECVLQDLDTPTCQYRGEHDEAKILGVSDHSVGACSHQPLWLPAPEEDHRVQKERQA